MARIKTDTDRSNCATARRTVELCGFTDWSPLAFVANPDAKPEVNHIDTNKQNNAVGNLEWCTTYENNAHARRMRLHKPRQPKITPEQADQIRAEYARGETTFNKLAARYGVCHVTILNVVHRLHYYATQPDVLRRAA